MFLILNLFILLNPTVLFSESKNNAIRVKFNNVLSKASELKDCCKKNILHFLKYFYLFIRLLVLHVIFSIIIVCLPLDEEIKELLIRAAFYCLFSMNYKSEIKEFEEQRKKLAGFDLLRYIVRRIVRVMIYCFIYSLMIGLIFALTSFLVVYLFLDYRYYVFFKLNEINMREINKLFDVIEERSNILMKEEMNKNFCKEINENLIKARYLSKMEAEKLLSDDDIKKLRAFFVQFCFIFHADKNFGKNKEHLEMCNDITVALNACKEKLDVYIDNDYKHIAQIIFYSFITCNKKRLKDIELCEEDYLEISNSIIELIIKFNALSEFKKSKILFFDILTKKNMQNMHVVPRSSKPTKWIDVFF